MSPSGGDNFRVPEAHALLDRDGTPIATYLLIDAGARRLADIVELRVSVERALPVLLERFEGMRVSAPLELGEALVRAGARRRRHAHVYRHDLEDVPPEPPGLHPLDRSVAALLPAYEAAFPPGHPDRARRPDQHLRTLMRGGLLDGSGMALEGDRVVGAILVGALDNDGPWVLEVFRDPGSPGTGRALLERALARAQGSLGLTVTEGNRAERLYRALGFKLRQTFLSVDL
jgi:hypothetical protein